MVAGMRWSGSGDYLNDFKDFDRNVFFADPNGASVPRACRFVGTVTVAMRVCIE
jgi:hypothetical protein